MTWKCPACSQEIRHDPAHEAPSVGVLYRCHVCHIELVLDGPSGALLATTFTPADIDDDRKP